MALLPLERIALEQVRAGRRTPGGDLGDEGWIQFGLHALLSVAGRVRLLTQPASVVSVKADGSPTTALESDIESSVRHALGEFAPEASFVGEESGGQLRPGGWTVVLDPIDRTYAYLGHTETFASVLTVFLDGEPRFGFVASPLTGEVGYAAAGGRSRLIRLNLFGEEDQGVDLPLAAAGRSPVLVNVHPARDVGGALAELMRAWRSDGVRMVRAPGGSPSWALLGAARGHFTYVNGWQAAPAAPWDLAAGVLLVQGAGGEVVDFSGHPIDPLGHVGPFVAGVRAEHRERILKLLGSRGDGGGDLSG
jgi:fructose-1,6-bisphosphatase/inositol monophosphatase family enzyme